MEAGVGTPLKNSFGDDIPRRIADAIKAVYPPFAVEAFVADTLIGYDALPLLARARHVAHALHRHLPTDYRQAIDILLASLGPPIDADQPAGMDPFLYAPHDYYVAEFGLDDWDTSMRAQYEITQRFSAEFSIRHFIERYPDTTLARLREWTSDSSAHVRRLVSEGTRPRLPWAPRLRQFQRDPSPVIELLELLKDDPSAYVRRSVANNLNDIGKDHPEILVAVCRRWLEDGGDRRRWVVRHALRSAVKRAVPGALDALGFDSRSPARISQVAIEPARPTIGGNVTVAFTVSNVAEERTRLNVDLRIGFVKANGAARPRVFKMRQLDLGAGERKRMMKRVSLRQLSTRLHYAGTHTVEAVVNGRAEAIGEFVLEGRPG
jgi:3-methyladenine DNA glycosylase AlkC